VVEATNHGDPVYVVTYTVAGRRRSAFFSRPREKAEALAFAEGVAEEQTRGEQPVPIAPITLEDLFARYQVDAFPALRPRSRLLYRQFWSHFVNFAGPHVAAEGVRAETLSRLRVHLEAQGRAVNTIRRVMAITRMVFRWGQMHELIERNRVSLYVYRVAKEARPVSPDEYRMDELLALLGAFNPTKGAEWRPWVALTLCGYQGARQHAVLHLRWEDVDLVAGTLIWRAEFDKAGREWAQPLRAASRAALDVAAQRRDGRAWVLPGFGRGGDSPYTIQALWGALTRAEERVGIPHRPRRGAHGLRRLLAGEVNERTGNAKLAMDAIGDRDIRQAERYLRPRNDRLRAAFEAMDQEQEVTNTASEMQADDPGGV
jgi:integrase